MSENSYFAAFFFPALAAALIFTMKYLAAIKESSVRGKQDEAYRDIAARSTAALTVQSAALADIQARLSNLETILKEVQ